MLEMFTHAQGDLWHFLCQYSMLYGAEMVHWFFRSGAIHGSVKQKDGVMLPTSYSTDKYKYKYKVSVEWGTQIVGQ